MQLNKRFLWLLVIPLLIGLWVAAPRQTQGDEVALITGHYIPLVMNAKPPTPEPTPTQTPPAGGWKEEYYANTSLTGSSVVRYEDYVAPAYDWGTGGPAVSGIGVDNFSARFTKQVWFSGHELDFWVTGDDGFRLYIDGQLKIDQWVGHRRGHITIPDEQNGTASFRWRGVVSQGWHQVKLEYFEASADARIRLFWTTYDLTQNAWRAEYFNNETLSGAPVLERSESTINHIWAGGSPGGGVNSDHFSARYTKAVWMGEQQYVFYTTADDGVRVYVDGWGDSGKVVDDWGGTPGFKTSGTRYMGGDLQTDGSYKAWYLFTVEFREGTGDATLNFDVFAGGSKVAYVGEYYNREFLNPLTNGHNWGTPTHVRLDSAINFDWGYGSPAPGIGTESFSVRWTKTIWLNPGTYKFTCTMDDGALVWLDGYRNPENLLISDWNAIEARTRDKTITTYGGWHVVVMEYIEYTREAVAKLSYVQQ